MHATRVLKLIPSTDEQAILQVYTLRHKRMNVHEFSGGMISNLPASSSLLQSGIF